MVRLPSRWFVACSLVLSAACSGGGGGAAAAPTYRTAGNGWLRIDTPMAASSFQAGSATMQFGGDAYIAAWNYSGQVAPSVVWRNALTGGSGTAVDTVDWVQILWSWVPWSRRWAASIPIAPGRNVVKFTAGTGAEFAERTVTISRPLGSDRPTLSLAPMAPGSPSTTNTSPLVASGTASGESAIQSVAWRNAANATTGTATGTSAWNATIPLAVGTNQLVFTVTDTNARAAEVPWTVTYDPTASTPFPAAPANALASAGDGAVAFVWDPVPGATSYRLYLANEPGLDKDHWAALAGGRTETISTTSRVVTGLADGVPLYGLVTAIDAAGEGRPSPVLTATPTAGAVAVVTLPATGVLGTEATLHALVVTPPGAATTAWFDYGAAASFGLHSTPQALAPGAANDVSQTVVSLTGSTGYSFRGAAQSGSGTTTGQSRAFSTPIVPAVLAASLDAPGGLVLADDDNLYWVEVYHSRVCKVPRTGGGISVLAAPLMTGNSAFLVLSGTDVTFADATTIWRVPRAGGTLTTLRSGLADLCGLAVGGDHLYWVDGVGENGVLRAMVLPTGQVTALATGMIGPLTADADGVCWTERTTGTLHWTKRFHPDVVLANNLDGASSLLLDGGYVYTAERTAVRRMSVTGGTGLATFVPGVSQANFLAVGGGRLFWSADLDSIGSMHLATGVITTVISGQYPVSGLTAGPGAVYWLTGGNQYYPPLGELRTVPMQ